MSKLLIATLILQSFVTVCHAQSINPSDAEKHVGKTATVCGQVVGAKHLDSGRRRPTFLDFGKPHPDAEFTAVIFDEDRAKFGEPETACLKKHVCVSGTVTKFRDKPQNILKDRSQLKGC